MAYACMIYRDIWSQRTSTTPSKSVLIQEIELRRNYFPRRYQRLVHVEENRVYRIITSILALNRLNGSVKTEFKLMTIKKQ